jgi:HEAT repeat protein/cyclophilin family peptidyl-prolyl cis-trans isomerase
MKTHTPMIAALGAATVILAGIFSGAAAVTRYASLMSSEEGRETLKDLALWEDQRVTGDGKLFEMLASDNPLLRLRAVEVIGRIQDPVDIPRLVPMLKDPDVAVVHETIFALGQMGSAEALPALLEYADDANNYSELRLVCEALGKTGGHEAIEVLIELLRDFNSSVRAEAALALARTEDPAAVPALQLAVHDPDVDVVWPAVYGLEKVEHPRTGEKVAPLLTHNDARVREVAARTLGKQRYGDAVSELVIALTDVELGVACNAAWALGEIEEDDACHPLGEMLSSNTSHRARLAAARALGSIGSKKGKDYLIQALSDESVSVRCAAILSLAEILGDEVEMFCDQMMDDGSRLVRAAAIEAYGPGNANDQADRLAHIARTHDDPMMRTAAVTAMGQLEDKKAVRTVLVEKLQDEDWVVATVAVAAIGEQEDEEAIPALIDVYRQRHRREDVNIRKQVLTVLTDMGVVEGAEIAREALSDPDWRIREQALLLLEAIGQAPEPEVIPTAREVNEAGFDRVRRRYVAPPGGLRHAVISTRYGDIEIELFGDDAATFVYNFVDLAKRGAYNGLIFHRVEPNFVVQGGDPRGDGWGDCGQTVPSQFNQYRYDTGYIGVPHDGKDSGGCQLFITHRPAHHLDGRYTIFGRVTSGMDVVGKIDRGDTFTVRIVD